MKNGFGCRLVSAVCALALLAALLPTAAFAAEPDTAAAPQTLTAAQVQDMQQADTAVTALTGSEDYAGMTQAQRTDAALDQLEQLVDEGLVAKGSIYADEENGMVSFAYTCGALGGILTDLDEENDTVAFPSGEALDRLGRRCLRQRHTGQCGHLLRL